MTCASCLSASTSPVHWHHVCQLCVFCRSLLLYRTPTYQHQSLPAIVPRPPKQYRTALAGPPAPSSLPRGCRVVRVRVPQRHDDHGPAAKHHRQRQMLRRHRGRRLFIALHPHAAHAHQPIAHLHTTPLKHAPAIDEWLPSGERKKTRLTERTSTPSPSARPPGMTLVT